jgi:hypothetical protein
MNGIDIPSLCMTNGVYKVDNGENRYRGSKDEFRLIEKVSRDIFIAAVFDIENLEQAEQPEKCTWRKDENGLLKAWC